MKAIRSPPDTLEEYSNDYGCLGEYLRAAVIKARNKRQITPNQANASPSSATITNQSTITPQQRTIVQLHTGNMPRGGIQLAGNAQSGVKLFTRAITNQPPAVRNPIIARNIQRTN